MKDEAYKIKYNFSHEVGDFHRDEILKECNSNQNIGAADKLLLLSVIDEGKDIGVSQRIVSIDGFTDCAMTEKDMFKSWVMMAMELGDCEDLEGWQRNICLEVLNSVRKNILR